MSDLNYLIGIILALIAGIVVNIGALIQKSVINKHSDNPKFIRSLVKSPLWIIGVLLQIFIGGLVFYFIAIIFIGPALVPGLMAVGLIVLALGSVKILNEKFNILNSAFIVRIIVFSVVILSLVIIFEMLGRRIVKRKGLIKAVEAGLILSLNTVWASPGTTVVTHMLEGIIIEEEIIFGIIILIIILLFVAIGITLGQISLKYGQANVLVPLTNVPIQIIPVIAFFIIFLSSPSNIISII
ncbi:MAG: hypothetical protein ACXABG_03040, partial [Promethearchaeota archaeon]